MIYDTRENLQKYAALLPPLSEIEQALDDPTFLSPRIRRMQSETVATAYRGKMIAAEVASILHVVSSGKEVVAAGYRSDAKRASLRAGGLRYLSDAPVHTVITIAAGEFVLFMPGEPFVGALPGSSDLWVSETLLLFDESIQG